MQNLKLIDVAFTGVDHVDLQAAVRWGAGVSNAAGYSTRQLQKSPCMMLSLLRNIPQVQERCRQGQTKDGLVGSAVSFMEKQSVSSELAPSDAAPPSYAMPLAVGFWALSAISPEASRTCGDGFAG